MKTSLKKFIDIKYNAFKKMLNDQKFIGRMSNKCFLISSTDKFMTMNQLGFIINEHSK